MEKNRVFGGKCYESLASYDRELSSWRTSQLCLFAEDVKSLDRLPKSGIARNGQLYPLETLELRISDGDGLQLPTPTASDPDKHGTGSLIRLVEKGVRYSAGDHRNLPTPTAHLAKESGCASDHEKRKLISHFQKKDTGERQVLSPLFVEWMMGFPIGWTDLER